MRLLVLLTLFHINLAQYAANWSSLDARPLPLWYDDSKFGIFTHWGVYSVPAYESEWFWWNWQGSNDSNAINFMKTHYKPGTTYADFAKAFTAIDFDANAFANIIKSSGARYFVLTTKHHEGYTMWPNKQSWNWNSVDVGPARDLLGEIRQAILKVGGIHFGTYFSLFEWFNPLYLQDKSNGTTQNYVDQIMYPQLIDLVTNYQPEVVWSDGNWERLSSYWRAPEFLAWLYNESPVKDTVVTNDRWGSETMCHHGGYYTCQDRYNPGKIQSHKWEDCDTVDKQSWGYRRDLTIDQVWTVPELIQRMMGAISNGGNYLLNIGPDHNGHVLPIFQERLAQLGVFVNAHQEAIFGSKPWIYNNESDNSVAYTSKLRDATGLDPYRFYNNQTQNNTIIYAFVLNWPSDNLVNLAYVLPTIQTTVQLFGANNQNITLQYTQPASLKGGIQVDISGVGVKQFPSTDSFVLRIQYAADQNVNPLSYMDEH